MLNFEGKVTDSVTVVDVIDPQAITAGAAGVLTGAIDMSNYSKILAIVSSGTLGSSGTLDATFKASTTSGGSYAAVGTAMTQLVKATNDNDIVTIELTQAQVAAAGKRYVKLNLVAGTANATSSAVVIGIPAHYGKASALNNADVVEIV